VWIQRPVRPRLGEAARYFPALVLTGARQVGKSSLLRHEFPEHHYVSLEVPSVADLAEHDPTAFFAQHPPPVIIDEVQYAPGIFRALKSRIDADRHGMGRFLLTGSQKFPLMRDVSESLAGRCAVLDLEGLSASELTALEPAPHTVEMMVRGGFPELWRDRDTPLDLFYSSYLATYLERDVRQLVNVGSLRDFERFVRACAARSGQLLNKSDLARDVGVSPTTAGEWLSVLVASNQVSLLEPWFDNVGKRLVKSPKLYLRDTGLLCFLLGVGVADFDRSPYRGAIFETWVYGELRKLATFVRGAPTIWFYRDQQNREADFILDRGGHAVLLDAKLAERPSERDAASLHAVADILRGRRPHPVVVDRLAIVGRPPVDHPLSPDGPWVVHGARLAALPPFSSGDAPPPS
jgi:predicted AAA+ superfamily ATPase